mmetsp:Transcript_20912/g.57994  ORF Transcript_20912/g.57994 Transcript_20912/m.57994 type:complete len:210 (+) Transcript_20912:1780-2409(+)
MVGFVDIRQLPATALTFWPGQLFADSSHHRPPGVLLPMLSTCMLPLLAFLMHQGSLPLTETTSLKLSIVHVRSLPLLRFEESRDRRTAHCCLSHPLLLGGCPSFAAKRPAAAGCRGEGGGNTRRGPQAACMAFSPRHPPLPISEHGVLAQLLPHLCRQSLPYTPIHESLWRPSHRRNRRSGRGGPHADCATASRPTPLLLGASSACFPP